MVFSYNNHFNECGVTCANYANHSDSGCSAHSNYCSKSGCSDHSDSSGYKEHSGGGYNNHYDESEDSCGTHTNTGCNHSLHQDQSYGYSEGCDNHSNYYVESGYNNHKNDPSHSNHFDDSRPATTLVYSITEYGIDPNTPGNWGLIKDSVDDLKALRDAIMEMPNKKLSAGRGSSRKHFTAESVGLSQQQNADEKFDAGQKPKKEQFNETRENIKTLWKKIKGNELTDVPDEIKPNKKHIMQKKDYQKFVAKVDELAREDQSDFYNNHYNELRANR